MPLDDGHIELIHERPGVYGLLLSGDYVYIGKADRSVRGRLRDHKWTLSGRRNLSIADMSFKSVVFAETWNPFKPEAALVSEFDTMRNGWNGKGFGIHDPGRHRDHTDLGDDHFHVQYPLNQGFQTQVPSGRHSAWKMLNAIKASVPFFVRYDKRTKSRKILQDTIVDVPSRVISTEDLLTLVARALGDDWQLTLTPSHFLLYRESSVSYPRAVVLWPGTSTASS